MPFFVARDRTPRRKRVASLTGSSGGIGLCLAETLHSEGLRVFAAVRDPAAGQALRREAPNRLSSALLDATEPDFSASAGMPFRDA